MLVGGIDPHRYDLSSMVCVISCASGADVAACSRTISASVDATGTDPDSIWSKGSITAAVKAARAVGGFSLRIDVECQSEAEAIEAIEAGADSASRSRRGADGAVVMLDNFSPAELQSASASLKQRYPAPRRFLIEISGGLTEENLAEHICHDVDILSTSSAHQSVHHIDFSLKCVDAFCST